MVLFSVSTPSRLSLFDQDASRPYELPSPVEFPALDGAVCRTAFSKTGAFACATEAGSVYVWEDVSRPSRVVQVVKGLRHDDPINALLLDSHDVLTVIYAQGFKCHLHDGRTSQRLTTFENYPSIITDISLSSDSQLIATGHESGQACVWNRQHNSHTSITLHPRMPIKFAQMHPSRRNILFLIPRSSPARVIVYDTLKASSPLKTIELAKLSNPSVPSAMAFHPSNSHVAVVTDGGDMWTLNLDSWSKRGMEVKVPLTSVGWAGKTTVAMGTETGRLLLRDVRNEKDEGATVQMSRDGEPVMSLAVQPAQVAGSSSSSRRKTLTESSAANETTSTSTSARDKYESSSSARRASSKLPSELSSMTASTSDSRRSQNTPASTSTSSTAYHPSGSSAYEASYRSRAEEADPTPAPAARMSRTDPSRTNASGTATKAKRVLWGDETNLGQNDEPRRREDEPTPRRTVSPPSSTTSITRRASPPRRSSIERAEASSSTSPTTRVAPSGSASSYRSNSPRSEGAALPPARESARGEVREDSPLIYAMSAQIRDLHLDMLRARRETKREMKALFKEHFAESKQLRAENERLKAEVERLRRGY